MGPYDDFNMCFVCVFAFALLLCLLCCCCCFKLFVTVMFVLLLFMCLPLIRLYCWFLIAFDVVLDLVLSFAVDLWLLMIYFCFRVICDCVFALRVRLRLF